MDNFDWFLIIGGMICLVGLLYLAISDGFARTAFCESKGLEGGFQEKDGIRCLGKEKKYCVNGSSFCKTEREDIIFPYKELQEKVKGK